ncbi:MAG: DUF2062 domain-containing protein [Gallionella sp.]|nr:DUF2062 domain-containing protein [Gallionella sp.]
MRKLFRKWLPHHDGLLRSRWLSPFRRWLQHSDLWHLHRRSASGAVAVGLFCGLIPGPLQMLGAALLAVLFRVNLPIALLVTLYTNPLTIVPLYLAAYEIGAWVTGSHNGGMIPPSLPEMHWHQWAGELWGWLQLLGKPLLVGLPLLAIGLALAGYLLVRWGWYWGVLYKWRNRHR